MVSYDFILQRRSIRKYRKEKIQEKDIKIMLEAARRAPIPYDYRTWELIVVKDKDIINEIKNVSGQQEWIGTAGLIVAGVIKPVKGILKWKIVDMTIALQNIVLISEALGYGSCWVGYFKENKLKEILGIPEDYNVLAYITIGVKDEIPKPRDYGKIEDFAYMDRFHNCFRL